ncbi:beta-3-deoxy-D-manno-oct-2-ulosonic acid transferase [Sphingomonas phyllosphaerae]|uniref:capsular polysaccharide export protein, LipB/KpsS family n=1 Tax=Sphingomonas phyllosphaerae TaxID=257003 RepID=UPI00241316DB|nr:beta-3-deoxy-D-manno-oct-2-ulosonic acid transferase [Sphingomonas phyllosphaerae]
MSDPAAALPLLRAPPFPGARVLLSEPGPAPPRPVAPATVERLFAALRAARVGGSFWAPVGAITQWVDRAAAPLGEPVDPWSVLAPGVTVRGCGDDEWIALAQIAGARVELTAPGRYDTPEKVAAALLARRYRDPFTGAASDLDATVALLGLWRDIAAANRAIVAACGIAWWKRREIRRVLWSPGRSLRFYRSERGAIAHAARVGGAIAVWPSRVSAAMARDAAAAGVPLVRVEDGFVRSVGLGSDMVPPSSITVDARGIHYDPAHASDLEQLLATATFAPALLARAARLRATVIEGRISKYGGAAAQTFPPRATGRRLVLVPGQVEDDMSVRLGGHGLASNLELLRRARALEPEAEIWFRPHPDVDAGHRRGAVRDADALALADRVVRGGAMADLLDRVDGVHVLTSLTGFEALLRGRDVTCHGTPFYAGWGMTRDLAPVPDRRGRALTLDELVAGVLILYPRYLDPVTALPCPPETLVARMAAGGAVNRLDRVSRIRRWQGRIARRWR